MIFLSGGRTSRAPRRGAPCPRPRNNRGIAAGVRPPRAPRAGAPRPVEAVPHPPRLAVGLQDMEVRRGERQRALDALLPLLARAVASQDDAPRPPGGLVEPADLDDQVALLLRSPRRGRASRRAPARPPSGPSRTAPGGSGAGSMTQVGGISARSSFSGRPPERLLPVVLQQVVVEEAERRASPPGTGRMGGAIATSPDCPGLEDEGAVVMLGQVEQLEEAVDDVDLLGIALDVEEQGAAERETGPRASCRRPAGRRSEAAGRATPSRAGRSPPPR